MNIKKTKIYLMTLLRWMLRITLRDKVGIYSKKEPTVSQDMFRTYKEWLVQLRQYSVWLRAGRLGDRGSIPDGGRFFF
jgi:NADPH-dependent 7-cyano-7-deazaguanine reductase QueF-like protein